MRNIEAMSEPAHPQQPPNTEFSGGWSGFTADWFSKRIAQWEKILAPFKGTLVNYLEVGVYEGRSVCWMLQNILTHRAAKAHCYDIFANPDYERRFDGNIVASGNSHKVIKRKGAAAENLRFLGGKFHIIYIDADHEAKSVILQAGLVWDRLVPGGILIFDDYEWQHPQGKLPPKPGIDAFLQFYEGEYTLLHKGWQVIVQKNKEEQ